jgi:hypothetical protein
MSRQSFLGKITRPESIVYVFVMFSDHSPVNFVKFIGVLSLADGEYLTSFRYWRGIYNASW